MAGTKGAAVSQDVPLVAATRKTILQLVAAANHRIEITEISVGFDGQTNTDEPVEVELVRQSDAGVGGDAVTPKDGHETGTTFDTTALDDIDGGDPTDTEVLRKWRVHPQTDIILQISDIADISVPAGERIALVCTAADAVNVDSYLAFTE